jgi:hypothetical protein
MHLFERLRPLRKDLLQERLLLRAITITRSASMKVSSACCAMARVRFDEATCARAIS